MSNRTGAVPGYEGTPLPEECSYQFQLGEEYLVYAYAAGEKLKASICSTLMIKNAAAEEKGLDQIKTHETIREKSNEQAQDRFIADTKSKSARSGRHDSVLLKQSYSCSLNVVKLNDLGKLPAKTSCERRCPTSACS